MSRKGGYEEDVEEGHETAVYVEGEEEEAEEEGWGDATLLTEVLVLGRVSPRSLKTTEWRKWPFEQTAAPPPPPPLQFLLLIK